MAKKSEYDPHFEIAFFESVLKHSPNFVQALMCLGDLYTKEGFYEKGLRIDERLAALRPDDAVVFYNLACSYSLMGELDAAVKAIMRAFSLGYDDFDHLVNDTDLINLLSDPRFQEILRAERARQKKGSCEPEAV